MIRERIALKVYYEEGKENTLGSNSVSSVIQDSKGRIWISTDRGGICCYNSQTDDFTIFYQRRFTRMMWLIRSWKMNNQIYGLEQIIGLVRFNPESKICGYIPLRWFVRESV